MERELGQRRRGRFGRWIEALIMPWPFATVNVVVVAGSVARDSMQRRMPSGKEVTELRGTRRASRRLAYL